METKNVVSLEDRIPKLKQRRKKKANKRAILLLSLFFILLILVLYFLSPLSNVRSVKVKGNDYLSDELVIRTSGISTDVSIWKMDEEKAVDRLKKLPQLESAELSISFPNTVIIEMKEYEQLGILVKDGDYHPVLSSGEFLEPLNRRDVNLSAPLLFGYKEGKELNSIVEALQMLPEEILNAISEIHHDPTETDIYHVKLYMNDGLEVVATSRTLGSKLVHYPSIVSQLEEGAKGVVDLEVGSFFRSYDLGEEETNEEAAEATEEVTE